ncbi:type II toxin-antitoxin system death-on-curing family toxin [Massilia sp. W12]|uniref:type II toxin-antitoxin system death-on-curing family toxin n=1 Tax=Massilia sp. W12 TaxID=3126507 RepID=UPI0030D02DA3
MIGAKKVMEIHDLVIMQEGGLLGDHGVGAIEGALSRVINRIMYEGMEDAYEIAAMYAVSIARGHVFNDANKRTALLTALSYLESQDIWVSRSPQLEEMMVDVAQGLIDYKDFAHALYMCAKK